MEKLQLKAILVLADEFRFEDRHANYQLPIKQSMKPSALIEALDQVRCIFLGFPRRPTVDVAMVWLEHQSSILEAIDVVNYLASVDSPDLLDFFSDQLPARCHS